MSPVERAVLVVPAWQMAGEFVHVDLVIGDDSPMSRLFPVASLSSSVPSLDTLRRASYVLPETPISAAMESRVLSEHRGKFSTMSARKSVRSPCRSFACPARISRLRSSSGGRGCVGLHDLDLDPVQVIAGRVAGQGR